MVEVDPDDPAFGDPTKFVGPVYDEAEAKALAAEKGWSVKPDGAVLAARRALPAAQADLRDPADELAARAQARRHLRRRRRHPDDVRAGRRAPARRRRGGHRQGPREQPARPRPGRRPVRHGDRRRRRLRRLGHARAAAAGPDDRRRSWPRMPFAAGSMGPKVAAAVEFATRDRQPGRDRLTGPDRRARRRDRRHEHRRRDTAAPE